MSEFKRPFTRKEMDQIRRATRDEDGLLADVWALVRRVARKLPFAEDVLALYYCARDPETDRRTKFIILAALAYFVMPADMLPDALPLLGFTDDAAVIATAIATAKRSITDSHRQKARTALDEDLSPSP